MTELVLTFETHPGRTLTLLLYKDCKNARDLRAALKDATVPECAFINANAVVDPFVLHLAAHRALDAHSSGRLATKSLHTELIYGLSGTKHVAESFKRFGITDDSACLIVARFDCTQEQLDAIRSLVQGTAVPLSELGSLADLDLVDKYYKITKPELGVRSRVDAVAFRIGAKDGL